MFYRMTNHLAMVHFGLPSVRYFSVRDRNFGKLIKLIPPKGGLRRFLTSSELIVKVCANSVSVR